MRKGEMKSGSLDVSNECVFCINIDGWVVGHNRNYINLKVITLCYCRNVLENGVFKSNKEFKSVASFNRLSSLIRIGLISMPPRLV